MKQILKFRRIDLRLQINEFIPNSKAFLYMKISRGGASDDNMIVIMTNSCIYNKRTLPIANNLDRTRKINIELSH